MARLPPWSPRTLARAAVRKSGSSMARRTGRRCHTTGATNSRKSSIGRMATCGRLYHALTMRHLEWDHAVRKWRDQELALFARRAHRQLGRGFVLSDGNAQQPVYVTWIIGAPQALIDAVLGYDPEHEALVVSEEESHDDSIIISCVTIEGRH
jgi:hypothetical protein